MKFDKNMIIGSILMVLLIVGYAIYQNKVQGSFREAQQAHLDSLARVEALNPKRDTLPVVNTQVKPDTSIAASASPVDIDAKYGILSPAASGNAADVVMENNKIRVVLSTKGGLIKGAELLSGYKMYGSQENIQLWDDSLSKMKFNFSLYGKGSFKSDEFYFTPSSTYADAKSGGQQLTMTLKTSDPSKYIEFI